MVEKFRREQNITVAHMARLCGMSYSGFCNAQSGARQPIREVNFLRAVVQLCLMPQHVALETVPGAIWSTSKVLLEPVLKQVMGL